MAAWGRSIASAPVTMCQRHPGVPLTVDAERSALASERENRTTLVCHPCPDCQQIEAQRRLERRLIQRGIPPRSVCMTLADWDPYWEPTFSAERAEAWRAASDWTKQASMPFLLILGVAGGTGKTALGVAALRAFGSDIRCLEFRDWIDGLIGRPIEDRPAVLDGIRRYRALMIDDVGNRNIGERQDGGNRMERDALATVLNFRFEHRLPTILTSNLTGDAFAAALDPRTVDRIRAGRVVIDASGWPSRRAAEGI
jgi:DNA replication protein DnaC